MTARSSGTRRRKPRSSWSRSAIGRHVVGEEGQVQVGDVDVDLERPTAGAPELVDAGVHQQPMDPGVEPIGIAQRGQITPGTDEGVLDGVRRSVPIPEHEPGGRAEAGDRGACQHGEGVMIALPRSHHEVSRHHAPQAVARLSWPRSPSMASGSGALASTRPNHSGRGAQERPAAVRATGRKVRVESARIGCQSAVAASSGDAGATGMTIGSPLPSAITERIEPPTMSGASRRCPWGTRKPARKMPYRRGPDGPRSRQ